MVTKHAKSDTKERRDYFSFRRARTLIVPSINVTSDKWDLINAVDELRSILTTVGVGRPLSGIARSKIETFTIINETEMYMNDRVYQRVPFAPIEFFF